MKKLSKVKNNSIIELSILTINYWQITVINGYGLIHGFYMYIGGLCALYTYIEGLHHVQTYVVSCEVFVCIY